MTDGGHAREEDADACLSLADRARLWVGGEGQRADPTRAALEPATAHPEAWPEMLALFAVVAEVFGGDPERPRNSRDPRVQSALARWAEDYTQEQLIEAIRGAGYSEHIRGRAELQTLSTILRDADAVSKYRKLLRAPLVPRKTTGNGKMPSPQRGLHPDVAAKMAAAALQPDPWDT